MSSEDTMPYFELAQDKDTLFVRCIGVKCEDILNYEKDFITEIKSSLDVRSAPLVSGVTHYLAFWLKNLSQDTFYQSRLQRMLKTCASYFFGKIGKTTTETLGLGQLQKIRDLLSEYKRISPFPEDRKEAKSIEELTPQTHPLLCQIADQKDNCHGITDNHLVKSVMAGPTNNTKALEVEQKVLHDPDFLDSVVSELVGIPTDRKSELKALHILTKQPDTKKDCKTNFSEAKSCQSVEHRLLHDDDFINAVSDQLLGFKLPEAIPENHDFEVERDSVGIVVRSNIQSKFHDFLLDFFKTRLPISGNAKYIKLASTIYTHPTYDQDVNTGMFKLVLTSTDEIELTQNDLTELYWLVKQSIQETKSTYKEVDTSLSGLELLKFNKQIGLETLVECLIEGNTLTLSTDALKLDKGLTGATKEISDAMTNAIKAAQNVLDPTFGLLPDKTDQIQIKLTSGKGIIASRITVDDKIEVELDTWLKASKSIKQVLNAYHLSVKTHQLQELNA